MSPTPTQLGIDPLCATEVPQQHRGIFAAREQCLAVGRDGQRGDGLLMSLECEDLVPRGELRHVDFAIDIGSRKPLAVGSERKRSWIPAMSISFQLQTANLVAI